MQKKRTHINSLDGIRAVAVMLVFVAHAGYSHIIPGGFGVTVFFFLSGYLITTLMRLEFEDSGTICFKSFYLRRVYRIFPPLYIVLLLGLVIGFSGAIPHNITLEATTSQFFHATNYYSIFAGNKNFIPGTNVLWSLAVEEHYYLLFPVAYLFLIKRLNLKQLAVVLAFFCLLVLFWRCYLVFEVHSLKLRTYASTDTRIDSIMFGCIMGACVNPVLDKDIVKSEQSKVYLLAASAGILLFCFLYRSPEFRQSFRYTCQGIALFPIFYLAILRNNWLIFRWLSWKPVKALGLISFTFYLSHMIIIQVVNFYFDRSVLENLCLAFIATVMFSTIMYILVERQMALLRNKLHVKNKQSSV